MQPFDISKRVAGVTGLEPAASGVTGQRSNQLSYTPASLQGYVINREASIIVFNLNVEAMLVAKT